MKWALLILAVLGTLAPVGASSRGTVKPWKLPPCNIENAANRSLPLAGQLGERFSLVLFWSTPCSSCLAKIRDVRAFSKAHEEDVALVMINTDPPRNRKLVAPWMRRFGFGERTYFDSNEETMRKLGGKKAPYLLLVGPEQEILFQSLVLQRKDLETIAEIVSVAEETGTPTVPFPYHLSSIIF